MGRIASTGRLAYDRLLAVAVAVHPERDAGVVGIAGGARFRRSFHRSPCKSRGFCR